MCRGVCGGCVGGRVYSQSLLLSGLCVGGGVCVCGGVCVGGRVYSYALLLSGLFRCVCVCRREYMQSLLLSSLDYVCVYVCVGVGVCVCDSINNIGQVNPLTPPPPYPLLPYSPHPLTPSLQPPYSPTPQPLTPTPYSPHPEFSRSRIHNRPLHVHASDWLPRSQDHNLDHLQRSETSHT